jgi:hypothetical protein
LLIGLHHVGTPYYNEAVLASSIYPLIQQYLPKPPAVTKPPQAKPPKPKPPAPKPPATKPPVVKEPPKRQCTANDYLTDNKDCE